MITLTLGGYEDFDYETDTFIYGEPRDVTFNHCLHAIAKWESRYNKPFLEQKQLEDEEAKYYFACMADGPITSRDLTVDVVNQLNHYTMRNMTATTFRDDPNEPPKKKVIMTSEILYGYMVVGQIPMECEYWHLTRLMALIRVVGDLQTPDDKKKKMSKQDTMRQNADLNAQRRAAMNSKG